MKLSSKKGFSLVELIIVIAIMGIIAAVGVPAFQGILQRTQVSADIRTGEGIAEAVAVLYAEDRVGSVSGSTVNENLDKVTTPGGGGDKTRTWYSVKNVTATELGVDFKEYYKESADAKSESDGGFVFAVIDGTAVVALHGKPATGKSFEIKKGDVVANPYDGETLDDTKIVIVAIDGFELTSDNITTILGKYEN